MSDPSPQSKRAQTAEAPSFESALEQLEEIVDTLEAGELPLEEALGIFERGVALSKRCSERLADAERRIEELTPGGFGVQPFGEAEAEDD